MQVIENKTMKKADDIRQKENRTLLFCSCLTLSETKFQKRQERKKPRRFEEKLKFKNME